MTIRVYADTSVYGGCFDPEFARASNAFFDGVRESRFVLVTSALVAQEIAGAPARVRALFDEFAAMAISVEVSAAAEGL